MGHRYPDFVFDTLPYVDMLLNDMHLNVHRKSNFVWELFEPYNLQDYKGLVDEWKESVEEVTMIEEEVQPRSQMDENGTKV